MRPCLVIVAAYCVQRVARRGLVALFAPLTAPVAGMAYLTAMTQAEWDAELDALAKDWWN